ncbi:hypothetical protein K443DRAFT_671248 [Laccaria amethystina LaAM-08-1]|uniref:E3 ubiquitin protein ligase n=1 Tax=Laccaria amethystina LaAM-08-1 TaxID=1095629 RepID=A0A0C9XCE8_9AGAR|nr:hypothetical protein K443DRAFT_671248 [Laccaria amethystina LaAM-08-1]
MESRKRPLTDDIDTSVAKKRILTGSNGSPHVNGVALEQDEPGPGDNLELFRKEAIYRRMKHYSRENERNHIRIDELERRKNTCEAGLAAMSACWAQLVEAIRLLIKPNDLPQVSIDAKDIFDLSVHIEDENIPELATALGDTVNATQALVTKFVQLGGGSWSQALQSDAFVGCQKAQTECVSLRSQINLMRLELQDCATRRDSYHDALIAAENRFERSLSGTVVTLEARAAPGKEASNGEKEDTQRKPSSPADVSQPPLKEHIHDVFELEALQELLKSRENKIIELERETAILRDEKTILQLELKSPSLEHITESPYYKVLLDHASMLEADVSKKDAEIGKLSSDRYQLLESRKEWEEGILASSTQVQQEVKAMLAKRDNENARLREQREQQAAELNERKHKDSVKLASLQELKTLVDSRSERILVLQSELSRTKAHLAANTGIEDVMLFFLGGNVADTQFIETLRDQKLQAEAQATALKRTLSAYQADHPDISQNMWAHADMVEKLSETTSQLEKYRRVYGDCSALPQDVSKLVEELSKKEAELERLRLVEVYHTESEKSLFAELEKLSTAWEALDRQVKNKVFDLSSLEDRLSRSSVEKAKSDNKFFAAMRDKEAIETERKNLSRTIEKQGKAVDRFTDVEKSMRAQAGVMEKENVLLKKMVDVLNSRVEQLEKETFECRSLAEAERKKAQEFFSLVSEREKSLIQKRSELRIVEEEYTRSKKELERQRKEAVADTSTKRSESENGEEYRKLLLCTTCCQNFRSVIITKCLHTFCKPCVDARISTRQRKCPACNVPFAQSDVQSFFFQ